jgi:exo-1,4-beta-D-glucosaminidase
MSQVCARMWDYSLEPTASLYHTQNALEPLHAQFDYLKNTVSVYNDYYQAFNNYKVSAEVYDLNTKKVWSKSQTINIPEDGVVNDIFTIDLPANITQVHFIKLRLYNEKGKEIANTFYWRSNDKYEGSKTLTGPTSSGFEDLSKLKQVQLKTRHQVYEENGRHFIKAEIKNTSSTLAFFTQLQLLDENKKPVRPSFYTDNFFSLLPGESKTILIETALEDMPAKPTFVVKGWNVKSKTFQL